LGYALNGKAWLYANTDKNNKAVDLIDEAIKLIPDDSRCMKNYYF
jgi:hypothetical protein